MTEALQNYLLSVTAVSLLASSLLALVPKGGVRRVLSLLCGLAVILTVIGPLARLDAARMARAISQASMASDEAASGVEVKSRELVSAIIKEKTEAYILDKAGEMGFTPRVEAEMDDGGDYPCPCGVRISGSWDAAQREKLSSLIEADLAIPENRQVWSADGT